MIKTLLSMIAAVAFVTQASTLAIDGTTGAPLGGIGCGAVKFCSRTGLFSAAFGTPAGMNEPVPNSPANTTGPGFTALANTQFQLYTNRGGTIATSQNLSAVVTSGRTDDDAIYPMQFANFGVTNGVQVNLTAFSPFDMAHLDRMCYPYVFYDVTLVNTLSTSVDVACALQTSTAAAPSYVAGKGFATAADRALYVRCSKSGAVISAGNDNGFFAGGVCSNAVSGAVNRSAGKITLAPNDSVRIGFVFSWFMSSDRFYYTNAASSAAAFADTGLIHFDELRATALELVTRMRASSVPGWFVSQLLNSLCNLTNNGIYTKDGRYCHAEGGAYGILGTMDQMWHARQINTMVVPYLAWQELEYWARTQMTNPAGQIHHDFDTLVPWDDQQHPDYRGGITWPDLDCGFIISVYEAFIATDDQARLNQLWPSVKLTGQRLLNAAKEMPATGYPYMYLGSSSSYDYVNNSDEYNCGLSIAAYRVMVELAKIQGDNALASQYSGVVDTASLSFTKRYLNGNFPADNFCESVLAGQWIGFFLKLGEFVPTAGINYALQSMDKVYQPLVNGLGSSNEMAAYLASHMGGLFLQTGNASRWSALQKDYYERNFLNRDLVFDVPVGIPSKVTNPNYSATNIAGDLQYINTPVSWRSYYDLVGFHRNCYSGELWLEPHLSDEMNHSMSNALIITPQGYATVSCTESGSAYQNKHIVMTPDSAMPVTKLYLRDYYNDTVSVAVNGAPQTFTRAGAGYARELIVAWSGTIPQSGITVDVGGNPLPDSLLAQDSSVITKKRRNAFQRIEAETLDTAAATIQTEGCSDSGGGQDIGFITNSSFAGFDSVDFGSGAAQCELRVAAAQGCGGTIELHLDATSGALIGTATVPVTGGWQNWTTVACAVSGSVTAVRNLYLVFKGAGASVCNVNWLQFIPISGTTKVARSGRAIAEMLYTRTARGAAIFFAGNESHRVEVYGLSGKRVALLQGSEKSTCTVGPDGASIPLRPGIYTVMIFAGSRSESHSCLVW